MQKVLMGAGLVTLGIATWVGYSHVKAKSAAIKSQKQTVWAHAERCEQPSQNFGDYAEFAEQKGVAVVIEKAHIETQVSKLRKGMSLHDVETILGRPSFADAGVTKDGDEYWGCTWNYVTKASVENKTLTLTEHLELAFDSKDALSEWQFVDRFMKPIDSQKK